MQFSCPEEYRRFDALRPGDVFVWADFVKPDYGYRLGTKDGFNLVEGAHMYLVVASAMSFGLKPEAMDYSPHWHVYAWSYNDSEFRVLKMNIPAGRASDVLVLSSPVR